MQIPQTDLKLAATSRRDSSQESRLIVGNHTATRFAYLWATLHTSLPRDFPRPIANLWRTYHVTDRSTTVFSCWKGSGRRSCVDEVAASFVSVFDVISPFRDFCQEYICLLAITSCRTVKMTIIVFLVDTSASMNQRTYMGTTILDTAKAAVETFMKVNLLISCIKLSVYRRSIVLSCWINSKLWYFRLDREIQTADGIVTCCWHSTNRRRTSEWVNFRIYSVDFLTDKHSKPCVDLSARFLCCLYRHVDDTVAITTKISREQSFPLLYAIFAFIVRLSWALAQCIIARGGNEAA